MNANCRILIVDDDVDICQGTSLRLQAAGYRAILARNGEEAVASAVANHPDAIVLDVRMPKLDGLTTLSRLKHDEETRNIPVVMLSASIGDRKASLDAGARYFLDKPYPGNALVEAVTSAIAESAPNERSECP